MSGPTFEAGVVISLVDKASSGLASMARAFTKSQLAADAFYDRQYRRIKILMEQNPQNLLGLMSFQKAARFLAQRKEPGARTGLLSAI